MYNQLETNSFLDSMGIEPNDQNYNDLVRQNLMDMGTSSQPAQTSFTNTSPTPSSVPSGVLDPNATTNGQQYDTSGYTMGSQLNPNGSVTIPNTVTGVTTTTATPAQTVANSQAGSPNPFVQSPMPTATPTPPVTPAQPAQAATPQAVSSTLPPELVQILQQLQQGLTSFQPPQVQYQPQTTPAYDDLVRQAIMQAIQTNQQPVNANDPLIAPMLASLNAQSQRAKEANQSQLAERLSAQHALSSGAFDTGVAGYNQAIDEGASNSLAQLMTNVLGQRQKQLQDAISMGANYLNADQARQLQTELANVNAAISAYQAKSNVGLGTLEALLQNEQFYNQLGAQIGEFGQSQNNNAVNSVL